MLTGCTQGIPYMIKCLFALCRHQLIDSDDVRLDRCLDDIGGNALAQHDGIAVAHPDGNFAQSVLALGNGPQLVAFQRAAEPRDLIHRMEAGFNGAVAAVGAGDDVLPLLQADGGGGGHLIAGENLERILKGAQL